MFSDISTQCSFITELDFLIIKNHTNFGIPGSDKFKKSIIKERNTILNKWFSFFPGIHSNNALKYLNGTEYREFETKSEFCCLLLQINESSICNKLDLKARLENCYDKISKYESDDINSIVQFLILLQNVKNVKVDKYFNIEGVADPPLIAGDTLRVNECGDGVPDYLNAFPNYMFSQNNLPVISVNSRISCNDKLDRPSFMSDLSQLSSVKSASFLSSSGYVSKTESISKEMSDDKSKPASKLMSIVSYPFSEFSNKSDTDSDYWGEEFMAEWDAFERGEELPRRFVWEDRGRNVGQEKPRMTEWKCPFSVGSGAICLALNEMRFNERNCHLTINKILNSYSVPMSAWINDLIMLRLGVASSTFPWDQDKNAFYLSAEPPAFLAQQFMPHIMAGTIYARLCLLINGQSGFHPSVIREGLLNRLRDVIAIHREVFTTLRITFNSILEFGIILKSLTNQIEFLGDLFGVNPSVITTWPGDTSNKNPIKKGGIHLVKYFYRIALDMVIKDYLYITFYLLEGCFDVVLSQLYDWIYKGQLNQDLNMQITSDFLIYSNEAVTNTKDHRWWQNQFFLSDVVNPTSNSWIFDELSREILRCGKSIRLLGLIDEQHALLFNPTIVKYRPSLQLDYQSSKTDSNIVQHYIQVVRSIAADTLKSQKEINDEKRKRSTLKSQEAQRVRNQYLKSHRERIVKEKLEVFNRKKVELEQLKSNAESAKQRKKEVIIEEKRLDRLLIDKTMDENRKVIDELKYDLTKLYAKKFADAEAREKLSLERIKQYELKLLASVKDVNKVEEHKSLVKEIIGSVVEEVKDEYNHTVIKTSDEDNSDLEEEDVIEKPGSLYTIDKPSHNEPTNDVYSEKYVSIVTKSEQLPSTSKKELLTKPNQHIIKDLEIKQSLSKNKLHFPDINKTRSTQGLDSSIQESIYPSNRTQDSLDDSHIRNFQQINTHGHSSDSPAAASIYPDGHEISTAERDHVDNFQMQNIHGHTSDSTVQQSLYPESHQLFDKKEMTHNAEGHPSDSSLKSTMYPIGDCPDLSKENSHIDNFKLINIHGHVSQSSIQHSMYPGVKKCLISQENNNSITETSSAHISNVIPNITSACTPDEINLKDPKNWLLAIQLETSERSRLLKTAIPYPANQKNESIASFFYKSVSNSVFHHIDRSILSTKVEPIRQKCLIIEDEPLDIIVNRSLVSVIMAQVRLVDTAIMYSILTSFKFHSHLKEIRRYLFLEDGKFSSCLLPNIFELISKSTWDNNRRSTNALSDVVRIAVNCPHSDDSCFCGNISLANTSTQPSDKIVMYGNNLDHFCLSYAISWPLNIVIHQKQIQQYQSIFRAIVQIKYASWCLANTRRIIKSWYMKSRHDFQGPSLGFQSLYSCLTEMEHWVKSIDSSLGNQVSGSCVDSWQKMINDLDNGKISNLDSLIESHATYLDGVMLRCVLGGDHTERLVVSDHVKKIRSNIRKMLIDVLALCSTYYRVVSIKHWHIHDETKPSPEEHNNSIVRLVQNLHNKFKKYGDCLLKVIKGASQDNHLDHLFVSLDYNEFYYKPTLV